MKNDFFTASTIVELEEEKQPQEETVGTNSKPIPELYF
jgi:hypothetical protein